MTQVDPQAQFIIDHNQLVQDAEQYGDLAQQQSDAVSAYHTAYEKTQNIKDPSLLFIALIFLFSQQGFNQFDTTLGQSGGSLQVQGDVTKCHNDIEAITNQTSVNDPNGVNYVKDEAGDLDTMLDDFNGSSTDDQNIQNALGGAQQSAVGALSGDDLIMRQYIYWGDDPNQKYNPTPVPNPGTTRTYYFDPDNKAYLQSYPEMHTDMQTPNNPKGANTVAKGITDQSNMNQQTTSSTNQASTEAITNIKNMISTLQSFTSDMMHAQSDQIKASIEAPK